MASIEEIRQKYSASGGQDFSIEGQFAVASFTTRDGRNGKFATVELRDASGTLTARSFDSSSLEKLASAGAIEARLRVSTFNGSISVVINSFSRVEMTDDDLLSLSGLDVERHRERITVLEGWLSECDSSIYGPVLRALFDAEGSWQRFCMAPAAVKMHHAEPGGLVRHLFEVGNSGLALLESSGEAFDRSFFLAGVFLHDIGKLDTYSMPPTIQYTAQGQLAEHQVYSVFRLGKACAQVGGIDPAVEARLIHLIEQAHGAYRHAEWQDPVGIEAKTLATADYFSSRLGSTEKELKAQDALDKLFFESASDVENDLEAALF